MPSATLTDCIQQISAIATRLQQMPKKVAALELQQCLKMLLEVQQQQQAEAPVHHHSESALHQANRQLQQYVAQLEAAHQQVEITLEELHQGNEELIASRQETEQQRQRYQDLFNLAPDGYVVTDAWGAIQEANQAARRLLAALNDRQILGKPLSLFIPLEQRQVFRTQLNQIGRFSQTTQLEINLNSQLGTSFSAAITVTVIQDWQGERDRLFWLIRDHSDKKRAELALKQLNQELEERVRQRTSELSAANTQLQAEITERLQIEAERSRLIAILDASADYIATASRQGNTLWNNPQLRKIRGLSLDAEVTHLQIADYHPQWALDIIHQQGIPAAIQDGVWVGETALLDEHEQEIPVSQMILAHKSAEGTVEYLSTVMRDISDQKRAVLALHKQEQEFRALVENSPDHVARLDRDARILYINPAATQITGWLPEHYIGKTSSELGMPENCHQLWTAAIRQVFETRHEVKVEFEYPSIQGIAYFQTRYIPELNLTGEIETVLAISRDITELKQTQAQLQETNNVLEAVIQSAPIAIDLLAPDGTVLLWNRIAEDIFGWSAAEVIGKPLPTAPGAQQHEVQEFLQNTLAGKTLSQVETRRQRKDGSWVDIRLSTAQVKDAQGRVMGGIGISQNISEQQAALRAQQQAEEAHRQSEARFRALMQTSPEIITFSTPEGGVFYQSPAVERILGYAPEEFVGEFPLQVLHPGDLETQQAAVARVLANPGVPISLEYRLRHKNGSWVWLEAISTNLLHEPNIQALVIFSRDIRDRKQAEEELRTSQHFIQKIADASPNLLYLYDLEEQRNIYVNREITQILGYTPEEVQAMGKELFPILMHPDDLRASPEKQQEIAAASDGEAIEFEYRLRHKNGEWRWLYSWDTVFARNADGKPTQILGTATDISDRKHLELALQQSEERFRTCVENLLDPLAIFSSIRDATAQIVDFRYEYINPAGCQSNQMPKEAMLGKPMCEVFPALRDIGVCEIYCEVVETGESFVADSVCLEGVFEEQQSQLFYDVQAVKLGDGFMVTWRDVTERKQADARIRASLQEKEVLLKEIHHRVKNNLQVILSLLKLQSSYTTDPQTLLMFQESQNRIRSMALIHELLYHSQDLAQIDFAAYIHTLVNQLARTYTVSTSAIAWEIDVEPPVLQLTIDTALPCGLLINELVSNALKYAFPSGQSGRICISLQACNNEEFILVISDNGVGISTDLDFRHTDSLGLQLICGTTAQLGGSIELDRTQGTTFTIRFKEVKYKTRG